MESYKGKTALITGASSGIGKAFAELLAEAGANLVITARSEDKLNNLAQQIKNKHSVQVEIIVSDLSQVGSAEKLYQQVQEKNISVDVLINNAGFGKWGGFLEFDIASYSSMLKLNINSLVELCHLFLPGILRKDEGGIINVASTAAFIPVPYAAVYSASKSFVLYFSEALYGECRDTGVSVMALCPGGTESNFAKVANAQVHISKTAYDTPELVAQTGLDAFLKGKCYVIAGKQNRKIAYIPRIFTRKKVIKLSGDIWKKTIGR